MFLRKSKTFIYEGRNRHTQQPVKGTIEADNEAAAREKLRRRGIELFRLEGQMRARGGRVSAADTAVFTRQLSAMVKAGVPLVQALEIAARGQRNPLLQKILTAVRAEVEQGMPLSQALAAYPKVFGRFYCNLIAAGEAGGVLERLLDRLAAYLEKTLALRKKVWAALSYPLAVLLMAVAVLAVMMLYVLPAFADVYADMGAQLPWFTRLLMDISAVFAAWWWLLFGLFGAALSGIVYVYRRSPDFRLRADGWLLALPVLGAIAEKSEAARWARTTATLFAAGVPLPEALAAVAAASGNRCYEAATLAVRYAVSQGSSLAFAMRQSGRFPDTLVQMAEIGGETGALDTMLDKAAQFYEEDVDASVAKLSGLMSPLIVLVLGGIIGVVLLGMYLPLFDLGNAVG
ncbi:MAG: type II secretion system F family protein [Neisseria sp.]|nr:type II secretion system F family protein [Neisseria sp.]